MNDIPTPPPAFLEQYKAYLQDLSNTDARYTTLNGFHLSIITALLGILALTKPGEGLTDLQPILRVVVPLFAFLLCCIWFQPSCPMGRFSGQSFRFFASSSSVVALFSVFQRERELIQNGRTRWVLENEERIPLLLILPFLIILLYAFLKLMRWI